MKSNPYILNYKNMNSIQRKAKILFKINKNILKIKCQKLKGIFMKNKIKYKN